MCTFRQRNGNLAANRSTKLTAEAKTNKDEQKNKHKTGDKEQEHGNRGTKTVGRGYRPAESSNSFAADPIPWGSSPTLRLGYMSMSAFCLSTATHPHAWAFRPGTLAYRPRTHVPYCFRSCFLSVKTFPGCWARRPLSTSMVMAEAARPLSTVPARQRSSSPDGLRSFLIDLTVGDQMKPRYLAITEIRRLKQDFSCVA